MLTDINDHTPVVVAGCRTPFLRAGTDFKDLSSYDLARIALKGVVDMAGLPPREIEHVIFGCVLSEPQTSNVAREAVIGANLPLGISAHTVAMACISGGQAITYGAGLIACGQANVVAAGGTECLSNIPILFRRPFRRKLMDMRRLKTPLDWVKWAAGLRPRDLLPEIPEIAEFSNGLSMGQSSDRLAARWGVGREEQDRFALRSHHLAARATEKGLFAEEILPVPVPPNFRTVSRDNGIRGDSTLEKLSKLPPAFYSPFGTATAGSSSFLSDGGAAALLMSNRKAKELGYTPLARIAGFAFAGCDPFEELLLGPAYAVPKLLAQTGVNLSSIDVFEFHEAFAGQVLANLRALDSESFAREKLGRGSKVGQIDIEKLNARGGSLSLGHPFGATGVRLFINCCNRLRFENGSLGLIASCAAGGLGLAMLIERMS
ncbi:MAG: acetyl-CoA C-acyltransferase [Syntrophobacteraceae bacterium]